MGWFNKKETRAEETGTVQAGDALLSAQIFGNSANKDMALQVPTVSGGIDLIANIIAGTPLKLYRDKDGKAEEIKSDPRVKLLNDDTGDTLDANQFWHAIIRDYYTGKGGYAYINRIKGKIKSIHYVDELNVSVMKNADPIFKDYDILVQGQRFKPYDFLKLLRNTKDGATGIPITEENPLLIETAFDSLEFERSLVKKGGNKKGFIKSPKKLTQEAMTALKNAFRSLYSNSRENVVVLNEGLEFQESSNTSVEMQLNENKQSNAQEIAKLFHISVDVMGGKAAQTDNASLARLAAIPLMAVIQCALNRDLLLEKEKGLLYWAFDTKELLKGDIKSRYEAYKTGLDANFLQIDEVRYAEDLAPLGLTWIKLGLKDVLYDPKTKQVFTPNTGTEAKIGAEEPPTPGSENDPKN